MKKTLKIFLALTLVLTTVLACTSCTLWDKMPWNKDSNPVTENTVRVSENDCTMGSGATTLTVRIEDPEKSVTFTVLTDKATVGEALLEHNIIGGENGAYGLYVKTANGILADYDVDQSYWAFYVGDDYSMTGVDTTPIEEGVTYRLVYTK
jgi:hypothetical protein